MYMRANMEVMQLDVRVNDNFHFTLLNACIPAQGIQEIELSVLISDCSNYLVVGDFNSKHHS